jgi:hypothetical protein
MNPFFKFIDRANCRKVLFYFLLSFFVFVEIHAQDNQQEQMVFMNTPVLFSENGQSYQQIVVGYTSDNTGKIIFRYDGKEILASSTKKGLNKFLLTFPAVSKPEEITLETKINDGNVMYHKVVLTPPQKKWTIYLVQHSHTDIGYTRPQSEILAEHMRYIDYALDYCDQTDNLPDEAKFRWTCESSWVAREYIRTRPDSQIKRLLKRIREGRIEVTGMFANMSEIADENTLFDFLQPLKEIKNLGIQVKTAMQNDVNGIAWCMPDYFKNTGVKYLIMGINETRSIRPFDVPTCFWWEAPSGERLLAFRGEHYMTGNFYNIEKEPIDFTNMIWGISELDKKGYPFDRIGIQFSGYFTDNAPPSTAACKFVEEWNSTHEFPKLKLAVASEFMEYVEENHAEELPVYRNAWLDWWTDGFGSISRETAEIRKTQNAIQQDEGLLAMVSMLDGELSPGIEKKIEHIKENIIFFDEHTVGAAESIQLPFSENSVKQWLQKGAYAWEAVKKETLLREETLARLQPYLHKADFPVIYIINPMGWDRSGSVELFIDSEVLPPEKKAHITDVSTGEKILAQLVNKRAEGAYWMLEVKDVPALGYKALKINTTNERLSPETASGTEILENRFYRVEVDKKTGAVNSLFDKELRLELVDRNNPYHLGQPVRETSEKRDRPPFQRTVSNNINIEKGVKGSIWESLKIFSDMPGFSGSGAGAPKGLELEIRLYCNTKKIEFKYSAHKEIVTDPEALYIAFPFSLPDAKIVFETTGGTLTQGQQLPGSSSDWNVAQNFVSVRSSKGQVVVVSNEVPLWQFSDFNMGKFERYPKPGKPWLYSWVMNNYWFTNFRAYQEGTFSWSYQLTSTSDASNAFASKFAWGERNSFATRTFPAGENKLSNASLRTLNIDGPENALLINIRPSFHKKSIVLHFRELEGLPADIKLSPADPTITIKRMTEINSLGERTEQPVSTIQLKPYEVKFIEVEI